MSYSIKLLLDGLPDWDLAGTLPDPTYNLTPIFDLALTGGDPYPNPDVSEGSVVVLGAPTDRPRGLRLLSGRRAADTTAWLNKAACYLAAPENQAALQALEPDNGWGDLAGACRVIGALHQAAEYAAEAGMGHVWEIV